MRVCERACVRVRERDRERGETERRERRVHACYGFSAVSERESVRYVRECAMAASHRRQEYRVEKKGSPAILASALTLLWPPQYRSLTRCACSCVGAADGAQFSTAIVALALRSRGWRAAAVGAAAAAGDARRRRRRRWRGPLWSGGGSGGPSVALPAREHTHTHNISSCAFAVSGWVRAVARTLARGGGRRTQTAPGRASAARGLGQQ